MAALIKSINPTWSVQQVKVAICGTVRPVPQLSAKVMYGGIPDAYAALSVNTFHSVTFDFNDDVREPFIDYAVSGSRYRHPAEARREGYVFAGWYTSASGGSLFDFNSLVNQDITVYAQWVLPEPRMYAVEFPDANFRREVLNLVGGGKTSLCIMDGYDFDTLASIRLLDVEFMGISDMTGLKYFTGLQTLRISGNQLTELDISNSKSLMDFICGLNQLTELDVSNNIALERIVLSINRITKLDVSKNIYLKDLHVMDNQLTELDVSNNYSLKLLSCPYNQITSLDVSKNYALDVIRCQENQLTTLDVSNNRRLVELSCSDNQLTELDVTYNTALEYIYCDENQLTTLDITNNTALKRLRCYNNFMESHDSVVGWQNYFYEPGNYEPGSIIMGGYFWFYPQKSDQMLTSTPTPTPTPTTGATPTPEAGKVEAFVTRIYNNVLERDPEEDGLAFWSNGLKSNDETAASIINNFFFGEEFLSKDIANEPFVKIAYLTFFDREAEPEGLAHWMDALDEGYNRRYVVDRMITSQEFAAICAAYGITVGPVDGVEGFVARMYRDVLNVRFDREGFDFWVNGLLTGAETGMTMAEEYFFSEGFYNRHVSNALFIEIAYSALMNRDPEPSGMAYWLDLLESGADRGVVLSSLLESDEFEEICDRYGIDPGHLRYIQDIDAEAVMELDIPEVVEAIAEEVQDETESEKIDETACTEGKFALSEANGFREAETTERNEVE